MKEYDFTLKFNLHNSQADPDSHVEKLYQGGCDDALIGIGKQGYISLNFIREASSAYEAVSSAIIDVKRVIPYATLIEATPDFVGLTDAAKILGCTRQNIRKLIITNEPKAPFPVYEGTPSIWHLAEILIWLREVKKYAINDALIEVAKINMNINLANSWQKVEPNLQENIKALVG
ncbi:DNA-binding protein [Mastigocoleus sp. MO_188.B34]|uniref:helix-turn-helix transcriptional regulator n=1 Tax=Mastigocoleus sp. MO_188.B34 TaxID=3036635 RepID=UPI0026139D42|nr:DNA-binding protein [Mastigocoleus sp. MO_188.B34]MDJ0694269.1 DNA-binding protein [Mastigocoleus sp. MO_188.B34]